jgi:hypothetical protein
MPAPAAPEAESEEEVTGMGQVAKMQSGADADPVCVVEEVRLYQSQQEETAKTVTRAFVDIVILGQIRLIDCTVKETPARGGKAAGPLRLYMPGQWRGEKGHQSFSASVALRSDFAELIEPIVLEAYHEKKRSTPAGESGGKAWRS